MKGLKLSKTSWLILMAGVFVVVLAGMGVTRSQQLKEQSKIEDEKTISETRLDKLQFTDLRQKLENLQGNIEESEAQLAEAKDRIRKTVVSVDVADELFKIAKYSGVQVTNLSTTPIAQETLQSVGCAMTLLGATVNGTLPKVIDFVFNLNNGYTTGYVQSALVMIEEAGTDEDTGESDNTTGEQGISEEVAKATVNVIVFSYEGK